MFDVARSRRMCCSRVESVSTKPRWPSRVDGLADEAARAAGARAPARAARKPTSGPPKLSGTPKLCASPHAMSAPSAPGAREQRERERLASPTTTSSAPARVRGVGRRGAASSTAPKKFGCCTTHAGGLVVEARPPAAGCGRPRRAGSVDELGVEAVEVGREHLRGSAGAARRATAHLAAAREAQRHQHRLGGRGGAVVHRGVRDLEPGERADHRLELEDRLQRALADLGLVRRVRGRELRARDERVDRASARSARSARAEEPGARPARARCCAASAASSREHLLLAARPRAPRAPAPSRSFAGIGANSSSRRATPIAREHALDVVLGVRDVAQAGPRRHLLGAVLDVLAVGGGVEQAVELGGVVGLDHRASSRRRSSPRSRARAARRARRSTSTTSPATGRVEVGDRLHRLDHAEGLAALERWRRRRAARRRRRRRAAAARSR